MRYNAKCKPELVVGEFSRQRSVRVPWGSVRAFVDGKLVATGQQSLGQRVRLTAHAVTAFADGSAARVSVGDRQVAVSLEGAREAIGTVGRQCRPDRTRVAQQAMHWTVVSGDISGGWAQAVMRVVHAVGASGIVIDANGGDLAEAEKLGRWIRDRGLNTAVVGECALACTQAFAGGVLRFIAPGARLGLQRLPLLGGDGGTRGAIARQTGYLLGLGIQQAPLLAERAAATADGSVAWLSADDAIALGLATELGTPGGIATLPR